jgi:hypothetical protein
MLDLTAKNRLHETQLIPHVDNLRELLYPHYGKPVNRALHLDGRISVLYLGRELLGQDYWFEFVAVGWLKDLVCEKKPDTQCYGQRTFGFVVRPHKNGVMLEVQPPMGGKPVRRQTLPYQAFVQEWCLMLLRLGRVQVELGSTSFHGYGYPCHEYFELIGKERITYTAKAPLGDVLADPVPF